MLKQPKRSKDNKQEDKEEYKDLTASVSQIPSILDDDSLDILAYENSLSKSFTSSFNN